MADEAVILKEGSKQLAEKAGGLLLVVALLSFFVVYPLGLSSASAPWYTIAATLAAGGACSYAFALSPLARDRFVLTKSALFVGRARVDVSDVEGVSQRGTHLVLVKTKDGRLIKISVGNSVRFIDALNRVVRDKNGRT
ncbi:MAG: hypothetical protein ACP5LS_05555 [Thermoprotei archaeon]